MPVKPVNNRDPKTPRNRGTNCTRRTSWGIFEVAYDDSTSMNDLFRLVRDLCIAAPRPFIALVAGSTWMSAAPAFSLYLSYSILQLVQTAAVTPMPSINNSNRLVALALAWLGCAITPSLVEYYLDENKLLLGAHLRVHFLPKLVKACLHLETELSNGHTSFPTPWAFNEGAPALDLVVELSSRARDIVTASLELVVVAHITHDIPNPDAFLLKLLCILFLSVIFLVPSNGVGGAGYTFWTKNTYYHRLSGLYTTIFDLKYRETIMKDGASEWLHKEYKSMSDSLGPVKSDALALACHIPLPWYWLAARTVVIDHPVALYCLTLPWSLSSTSLTTIVLVQHAMATMRTCLDRLRQMHDPSPVLRQIQEFYQVLDRPTRLEKPGANRYPTESSSQRGMKVSLRHVSSMYQGATGGSDVLAVDDISLDIEPGQLVVVVGGNGSGKTSLLKLLVGLNTATRGEVFIDDRPLSEYDICDLRCSTAFLTQSEEIFPISIRDNFLMALPDVVQNRPDMEDAIDRAAQLGQANELIQRLGYDLILNPPGVAGQSIKGCGNGDIGLGATEELQRNSPRNKETILSDGEKQRLVASRTFMRLKNSDIRFLIVDEPTSALDPVAERDIINNFCDIMKGKTMICVTHRFGNIVKHADLIICMKGGKIIQRGTHASLMLEEEGEYRRLYDAQRGDDI